MAAILADDIFKCIFLNDNDGIQIQVSLKVVPKSLIGIGLDNGLAPNRRHDIFWTNVDPIHWRIYVSLGGDVVPEAGISGRDKQLHRAFYCAM